MVVSSLGVPPTAYRLVGSVGSVGPVGPVGPVGSVGLVGSVGSVGPVGFNEFQKTGFCSKPFLIFSKLC